MTDPGTLEWTTAITQVTLGATKNEGGTRSCSYTIGGETDLPFIGTPPSGHIPLVAFEICDDLAIWPLVAKEACGDVILDTASWAKAAGTMYGADLVRLNLTSTKKRGFSDFDSIGPLVSSVLKATTLPLIIEGSMDQEVDSLVFQKCGEAGQGERLLLGTAEAARYRSVAAAAMAYGHSVIAQSPIDVNLAKQLNILLRETGVPDSRIVIDPYTGALGYGFEYTYSTIERIRFSAMKGDRDLAMPVISAPSDALAAREIRESPPSGQDGMAVAWEYYTALSAAIAGAAILVVRHPRTVGLLKTAIRDLWDGKATPREVVSDGP